MKLSKQAAAAKREYMKKWRANNKDKIKGYQEKYWQKKADEKKGYDNDK